MDAKTIVRIKPELGVTCRPLSCFPVKTTYKGAVLVQLTRLGADPVSLEGLPVPVNVDRP